MVHFHGGVLRNRDLVVEHTDRSFPRFYPCHDQSQRMEMTSSTRLFPAEVTRQPDRRREVLNGLRNGGSFAC